MMLRSSSTPLLGSLLPSESPNHHHRRHNHHDTTLHHHKSSPIHKFSFPSQHFTPLSCTSSPISNGGIRRAQSEGNLESLMSSGGGGGGGGNDDEFSFFNKPKKLIKIHGSLLDTIPSFSYQNSRFKSDEDESSDNEEQQEEEKFRDFNIQNNVLSLNKQMGFGDLEMKEDMGEGGSQMYLAKGIGVDAGFGCGDGGGRRISQVGGGGGGDGHDVEEHYRKMVNENPGNSLFLGNYAQFLYQSKQDLEGAEEYYSRAILVGPNDGEILSQYAKLLWELHRDKDRATSYFERAVHAASEDSHVHAAYASFLWEVEGEEEDDDKDGCYSNMSPVFNNGKMASATA